MKNEIIELEIEDLGSGGEGIGKREGYTFFVKDALPGDLIQAKILKENKNYGFARVEKILKPSPFRVDPPCSIAGRCGGCQIQHLDYGKQLEYKESKVRNNLERIGGFKELIIHPIIGMEEPFRYRNKSQFPIGKDKEGNIVAGFYAGRTHSIIPLQDCLIAPEITSRILNEIKVYIEENNISVYDEVSHKGLLRHVLIRNGFFSGEIMVLLVINGEKLPAQDKLLKVLGKFSEVICVGININKEKTNVILGEKVVILFGKEYIQDSVEDLCFQISPLSFYQVNPRQTQKLYSVAMEYTALTGKETVWDLYCGTGTISLFLAQKSKEVFGVEVVEQAIEDARRNARLNGITNVKFFVGKSEDVFVDYYKNNIGEHPDVVVIDPPRKGCDEDLLESIGKVKPDRIVYVSCDSATLARDLKSLCEKGYGIKKVQPVDMFPHSVHVETVVLMSRVEK